MFKAGTKLLRFCNRAHCLLHHTKQSVTSQFCGSVLKWVGVCDNVQQGGILRSPQMSSFVGLNSRYFSREQLCLNISLSSSWIMWSSNNKASFHHIHNLVFSTGLWFAVKLLLALHLMHTQPLRLHKCMKRWQVSTSGKRTSGVFSASVFEWGVTLTCMATLFAWPHTAHAFGCANGSQVKESQFELCSGFVFTGCHLLGERKRHLKPYWKEAVKTPVVVFCNRIVTN